jgi:hypothetical protein
VRPDVSQSTHGFVKEDTLGDILFLRLKTGHLHPKDRLFNCSHYATDNASSAVLAYVNL